MKKSILFHLLLMRRNGRSVMICLETDIVASAPSYEEAMRDMNESIGLYMDAFTEDELRKGAYLRSAPFRYRVAGYFGFTMSKAFRLWDLFRPSFASYNPKDHTIRFAN